MRWEIQRRVIEQQSRSKLNFAVYCTLNKNHEICYGIWYLVIEIENWKISQKWVNWKIYYVCHVLCFSREKEQKLLEVWYELMPLKISWENQYEETHLNLALRFTKEFGKTCQILFYSFLRLATSFLHHWNTDK